MEKELYKLGQFIAGKFDLVNVWTGLVASIMGGFFAVRVYFGEKFAIKLRILDVIIWFVGVYFTMRFGMAIIKNIPLLSTANKETIDSAMMGFFAGAFNVWLFKNNYRPIKDFLDAIFGKFLKK